MDNISETVVILLPGFDKESVLEALVFLSNGEIATDYCPRSIQKIIYFVLALIPDMDILSFEIERIFQESEEDTGTVDSAHRECLGHQEYCDCDFSVSPIPLELGWGLGA